MKYIYLVWSEGSFLGGDMTLLGIFETRKLAEESIRLTCHKLMTPTYEETVASMRIEERELLDRVEHL